MERGTRITSESSPGAWPVLLPSKFHLLSWSTLVTCLVTVLALDLQFSIVPSIQMYSTMVESSGVGNFKRSPMLVAPVWPLDTPKLSIPLPTDPMMWIDFFCGCTFAL